MFRNLLKPDSPLMITMNQITDVIFLSLFWLVCSFPLITAGAATAALYDTVYHTFRKGEKNSWQWYFRSFRRNLKGSILSTLVFLGVFVGLGWILIQVWNSAVYGNISWTVFAFAAFLAFALTGVLSILFPMHSRFVNAPAVLWGNTFRLGFSQLPLSLMLAAVNCICAFFCIRYLFPLFFLPGLACLIGTLFLEPMFRPYMPEEPTEE